MLELHGVLSIDRIASENDLKRYIIHFDKLRFATSGIFRLDDPVFNAIQYLKSVGVVHSDPVYARDLALPPWAMPISPSLREVMRNDIIVRHLVQKIGPQPDCIVVGVYDHDLWAEGSLPKDTTASLQSALSVGFSCLPQPDETNAFEGILDFRQELRNKQWAFRRFLRSLSTKQLSESEMRDEIEWLVAEYTKAMELYKIKSSKSFFEAVIIPTVEVLEDLVNLKWSKVAKLGVAAKQRKIDMLENELKAPGRECAYVFEARKRFSDRTLE